VKLLAVLVLLVSGPAFGQGIGLSRKSLENQNHARCPYVSPEAVLCLELTRLRADEWRAVFLDTGGDEVAGFDLGEPDAFAGVNTWLGAGPYREANPVFKVDVGQTKPGTIEIWSLVPAPAASCPREITCPKNLARVQHHLGGICDRSFSRTQLEADLKADVLPRLTPELEREQVYLRDLWAK
jgi:hypothetical protein